MIIDSYCGSFPKIPCVKRTSKQFVGDLQCEFQPPSQKWLVGHQFFRSSTTMSPNLRSCLMVDSPLSLIVKLFDFVNA